MLLDEMEIFYYVVIYKSFSQAATQLGVSKAFVSKHINKLESNLNTKLLARSTRQLNLTEAGELFFQHCQDVVKHATYGYDAINELQNTPTGTLKISAPPAYGTYVLPHILTTFHQRYPKVTLEISLESQITNMIQQGFDIVLRSAMLEDSNLISQQICSIENIICASPAYLQQHPSIDHPQQLSQHPFSVYPTLKPTSLLVLKHQKQSTTITLNPIMTIDHLELTKQMLLAGNCLAILPIFMVTHELKNKQLIQCLPEYSLPPSPLHALYLDREFTPIKIKTLISLLKQYKSGNPP